MCSLAVKPNFSPVLNTKHESTKVSSSALSALWKGNGTGARQDQSSKYSENRSFSPQDEVWYKRGNHTHAKFLIDGEGYWDV